MTAEDVPTMLKAYDEAERTRQANVGQILNAYNLESQIAEREKEPTELDSARAALARAQVAKLGEPAETLYEYTTPSGFTGKGTFEQIARLEAAKLAKGEPETRYKYTTPSGFTGEGTFAEIAHLEATQAHIQAQAQTAQGRTAVQERRHQDMLKNQAMHVQLAQEAAEERRGEHARKAEEAIQNPQNAANPALEAEATSFNANSPQSYIWEYNPPTNTGLLSNPMTAAKSGMKKIPIPPIKYGGKPVQLSAREVTRWASMGDPANGIPPMPVRDWIEKVLPLYNK